VAEYSLLFYTKYWFTTPLVINRAVHDLDFMSGINEYRKVRRTVLERRCLGSCAAKIGKRSRMAVIFFKWPKFKVWAQFLSHRK
jgi:hypothetical protein